MNIIPVQTFVNEFVEKNLELYPNPVNEVLFIKNLSENAENYLIFNAVGQEVQRGTANNEIQISNLDKGLYIIKIGNYAAKFIVD